MEAGDRRCLHQAWEAHRLLTEEVLPQEAHNQQAQLGILLHQVPEVRQQQRGRFQILPEVEGLQD